MTDEQEEPTTLRRILKAQAAGKKVFPDLATSETFKTLQALAQSAAEDKAKYEQQQADMLKVSLDLMRNSPEARTARAAEETAEAVAALVDHAIASTVENRKMLHWSRIAAIAGLVAIVVGVVAIIISVA